METDEDEILLDSEFTISYKILIIYASYIYGEIFFLGCFPRISPINCLNKK